MQWDRLSSPSSVISIWTKTLPLNYLNQYTGDGGCDINRLSLVASMGGRKFFEEWRAAISTYRQYPGSPVFTVYSQFRRERDRDEVTKRLLLVGTRKDFDLGYSFEDAMRQSPWNFSSCETCKDRMQKVERCFSGCPYWDYLSLLLGRPGVPQTSLTPWS